MINTNKLKGLMREKGITQAELAKKLGIMPCSCNLKINNRRDMTLDEAEVIADVLGIEVDEFGIYFFSRSVAKCNNQ